MVKPSLVRIAVVWTEYEQGREIKYEASDSGTIISTNGYIITNHHVAGRAARLMCVMSNNEEIEATLIGTDALSDIAVIQLKGAPGRQFPAAAFGDSDALNVGDPVMAMGSPLALSQSVTLGIVSNLKMVMPRAFRSGGSFVLDGEDVGSMVRWIAHDASIYPGNSGGPLVNMHGEIVGINEISFGLSGAIPGNLARRVADQIIEHGSVQRSWLGVDVQPLLKDGPSASGVLIGGVVDGSPAARAGLQAGDILTQLDGKPVSVRFDEEIPLFNQTVSALPVGKQVDLVVQRGTQTVNLKLTTGEREPAQLKTQELKSWGFTARDISQQTARELKLNDPSGVLVTSVRPGGPSGDAKPPLESWDVLREVNGTAVTNLGHLLVLTKQITTDKTEPVPTLVRFDRKREVFLTVVRVGIEEDVDPGLETSKAWLPVAVQAITREMAAQLHTNGVRGVRITQVYSNSTAAAAGLLVGDLILAIDGDRIPVSMPGDEETFTSMIRQYPIGAQPVFTIVRDGQALTQAVELARSPRTEREMKRFKEVNFEFTARDVSFFDKESEGWPEIMPGAVVVEVTRGGWAALGELEVNDLIQMVDGEPVADVAVLEDKMKQHAAARPRYVVLKVLRGVHTRYLQLETSWNKP